MQSQPDLCVEADIYNRPFPRFDRPQVIGYIGLENLKFARRIRNETVKYDLNYLIDKAKVKPQNRDPKLTDLLMFLQAHEGRLSFPVENNLENARFYCYRGLMTCLACTPFENREGWKIVALLHRGNIYLCARDTEDKLQRKQNMTDREKQFTSWGYKFEQYLLSNEPDIDPNPHIPLDENEEFSLVFTTHLNNHTIVYGAEMDGIRCDKTPVTGPPDEHNQEAVVRYLSDKEFVELKTNRHIENRHQDTSFRRFKCKKWWCQSFLAGIDTIICGFRNDDGIVEETKIYNIKDVAKMSQRFWSPNVSLNFLSDFLTYVKRCFRRKIKSKYGDVSLISVQKLPLITLLFEWTPGMPILVNENYEHENDVILPKEFLETYGKRDIK